MDKETEKGLREGLIIGIMNSKGITKLAQADLDQVEMLVKEAAISREEAEDNIRNRARTALLQNTGAGIAGNIAGGSVAGLTGYGIGHLVAGKSSAEEKNIKKQLAAKKLEWEKNKSNRHLEGEIRDLKSKASLAGGRKAIIRNGLGFAGAMAGSLAGDFMARNYVNRHTIREVAANPDRYKSASLADRFRKDDSEQEKNIREKARMATLGNYSASNTGSLIGTGIGGAAGALATLGHKDKQLAGIVAGALLGGAIGAPMGEAYSHRNLIREVASNPERYKQAAVEELVNNGFDFDQAVELVKQADENRGKGMADLTPKDLFNRGLAEGGGKALGAALIGAAGLGVYGASKAIINSNQHSKFLSALKGAIQSSALLRDEDPRKLLSYGETIFKFAPSIASDRHLLVTLLETAVRSGGLDYSMIKSVAEVEGRQIQNTKLNVPF